MFQFYILLAILVHHRAAAWGSYCGSQILPPGTYYRARVQTYNWFAGSQTNDWVVGCYFPSREGAENDVRSTCNFHSDQDTGCYLNTLYFDPPRVELPPPPQPKHRAGPPRPQGGCYQRRDNFVDVDCYQLGRDECFRQTNDVSGCAWKEPPPPPKPRSYALFIINNDSLYCVNGRDDPPLARLMGTRGTWVSSGAIVEGYGTLFVAEQYLYTADRLTGAPSRLGTGDWKNSTSMAFAGNNLFIVQAGALHDVNPGTGTYKVLGDIGAWTGHTSMTAEPGNLYIIQDERLWRVDPATGKFIQRGSARWHEPAYIAMAGSTLVALENSGFQVIDKNTGSYKVIGGLHNEYLGVTAFGAGGNSGDEFAFAIASGRLWRIKVSDGSFTELGGKWTGPSAMWVAPNLSC